MELIDLLREADAVRFGEFELSHGGTSSYYVDKYVFETDPACLEAIAAAFAERVGEVLAGPLLAVDNDEDALDGRARLAEHPDSVDCTPAGGRDVL